MTLGRRGDILKKRSEGKGADRVEDGLQERMERLSSRQGLCLKVRAALAVLTLVWYELAAAVLPAHMAVVVLWGGPLSDRAAALARERYPGVPARVGVIGKGA